MPRRPDTVETVHLAIELMRRIPRTPRKVTAGELHQQLVDAGIQRDLRSVQRQLRMLVQHFGIECDDREKPYGYSWAKRAQGLSLPQLNEQESLLLSLAEQHLHNLLPAKLLRSMEGFFSQARQNLYPAADHERSAREREWLQKVRVVSATQPLLPPAVNDDVFTAISNALYANRWLSIAYRNRSGKLLEREVMPLGLAQQGEMLYLVCRFQGYENERSLALHRFESARETTLSFPRPKGFDLRQYDNDGRFGYGDGKRIRLSFCITRDAGLHLLEAKLSKDQVVRELDDGYEITATVVDSAQLQWWLQGFGDDVWSVRKEPVTEKA